MSKPIPEAAFPVVIPDPHFYHAEAGMDLRDYFAAQVISALIAIQSDCEIVGEVHDAYLYADAMMEARKQKQEGAE